MVGDEAVFVLDAFEGLEKRGWLEHWVFVAGEAAECFEAVSGFESGEISKVSGCAAGDERQEFVAGEILLVQNQAVGCGHGGGTTGS